MYVTIYAPQGHLFPRAVPTGVPITKGGAAGEEWTLTRGDLSLDCGKVGNDLAGEELQAFTGDWTWE